MGKAAAHLPKISVPVMFVIEHDIPEETVDGKNCRCAAQIGLDPCDRILHHFPVVTHAQNGKKVHLICGPECGDAAVGFHTLYGDDIGIRTADVSEGILEGLCRDLIPADSQLGSIYLLCGRLLQGADLVILGIGFRTINCFSFP